MSVKIKLDDNDFQSKEFPKVLLPRKETRGQVIDFRIVPVVRKLKNEAGDYVDTEIKKIVMEVEVPEQGKISAWYNPNVTKPRGKYRASELFKLLSTAKLVDKLGEVKEQINTEEDISEFLKQNLMGKTISFVPVTITPANGGADYSGINEVLSVE